MPAISVIIPVYNVAPYLAQCLDSVVNQTFTDLQIIIVDDGSTDEGGKIADDFASKDKRIEVYHRKNAGLCAALNYGISAAKGEYIAQVDSDDALHPKMYEILYSTMKQYDADMTCCKWSGKETVIDTVDVTDYKVNQINPVKDFTKLIAETYVYRWNKLLKKELFNNYKYPEGHVCEGTYIHRIAFSCRKAVIIDIPLYYYRSREESFIHTYKQNIEKRINDAFLAFDDRISFMFEHNWTDSYVFNLESYCNCIMSLYSFCDESNDSDGILRKRCRNKMKELLRQCPQVKVSKKYHLWANCMPLYRLYKLAARCWGKAKSIIRKVLKKK